MPPRCSIRAPRTCGSPRPLPIWTARHAHLGGAGQCAGGARRRPLCRRRAVALGSGGGVDRAAVGLAGGRPRAGHRQRLSSHPKILRRGAGALRHRHELLRPAHRRPHRRSDPTRHARDFGGIARIAFLRNPGCAGDRGRGPRQGRGRADGQYLGKPALFPRLGQRRRSVDPIRHQIYRRPFRRDARHRIGQRGDLAAPAWAGRRDGAVRGA